MEYSLEQLIEQAQKQLTDPKLQDLLRAGLADRDEIEDVKRAIRFGEKSLTNPGLRQKLYKTFDRLLGIVKQDANIRSKVRADLQKQVHAKDTVVGEQAMDLTKSNVDKAIAHDCAKHVVHETWGHGQCIPGQHTLDEVSEGVGIVTHYDVMFEHGIEQDVPVGELEILVSESHMHSKKKKMAEELKHEFAKASNRHPELDDDGIPGKRYYSNTDAKGKTIKPNFALPKAFPGLGKAANQGMKLGVRKEEVEQLEETTGVINYNPRSQGGTRTELLKKLAQSKSPKDAEAARKAGATQNELKAAMTKEEVEQVNEAPLSPEHKAAIKTLQNIPKDYSHSELKLLSKHADSIASKAANAAHAAKKKADPFKETGSTMTNADGHKIHLKKVGANSFEYTAHATKGGPAISNKFGQSISSIRNAHKKGMYDKHFKEEVEQIDELKKSTLASYATKAAADIRTTTSLGRDFEDNKYRAMNTANRHSPFNMGVARQDKDPAKYRKAVQDMKTAGGIESDFNRKAKNRIKGIGRAAAKLAKEEVEQMDEISMNLVSRFRQGKWKQAEKEAGGSGVMAGSRVHKKLQKSLEPVEKREKAFLKGYGAKSQYELPDEVGSKISSGQTVRGSGSKPKGAMAAYAQKGANARAAVRLRDQATRKIKAAMKEEVEGTHPKTEKERKLAGLAPPHDKITHADVMVGRGVNKKKTMKEFVELLAKRLPSEEE